MVPTLSELTGSVSLRASFQVLLSSGRHTNEVLLCFCFCTEYPPAFSHTIWIKSTSVRKLPEGIKFHGHATTLWLSGASRHSPWASISHQPPPIVTVTAMALVKGHRSHKVGNPSHRNAFPLLSKSPAISAISPHRPSLREDGRKAHTHTCPIFVF